MLNAQPVSFSWSFFAFVCVFIHMFFVAIFQCSNFRFIAPAYFLVWKCFNILFRKSRRNAANLMAHIYFALLNLLFAVSPTRSLHSLPFASILLQIFYIHFWILLHITKNTISFIFFFHLFHFVTVVAGSFDLVFFCLCKRLYRVLFGVEPFFIVLSMRSYMQQSDR